MLMHNKGLAIWNEILHFRRGLNKILVSLIFKISFLKPIQYWYSIMLNKFCEVSFKN